MLNVKCHPGYTHALMQSNYPSGLHLPWQVSSLLASVKSAYVPGFISSFEPLLMTLYFGEVFSQLRLHITIINSVKSNAR